MNPESSNDNHPAWAETQPHTHQHTGNMKSIKAETAFDASYNCAQSVLIPFLEQYGIPPETGLKLGSGFGAGMARMQETCGAVTGALMVLGFEYGFTNPNDQQQRDLLLAKSKDFVGIFTNRFGTISCRGLLQCDLNTPEGQKKHKEENQRDLICRKCIVHSVTTLEGLIGSMK